MNSMLKNRFLLGSLAFGLSFGISLVTTRDVGKAVTTGLTTLPATIIAAIVVDRRFQQQANSRIAAIKGQLRALQKRRSELYQSLVAMQAEKNQAVTSPAAISLQPQSMRLPVALPRSPQKPLSWDLSSPFKVDSVIEVKPHELPTELQAVSQSRGFNHQPSAQLDPSMEKMVAEATVTKRKIEANLKSLQAELNQLQAQNEQQRKTRDRLTKELTDLEQQKQRLQTDLSALKQDVDKLKRCQKELNDELAQAEAKKREIETGSHPLHTSLKQLQTQASTLQEELHRLEIQIRDRQQQKAELEQQLATLKTEQQSVLQRPVPPDSAANTNGKNGHATPPGKSENPSSKPEATARPTTTVVATARKPAVEIKPTVAPEPAKAHKSSTELPEEWTEFMLSLPEYEVVVMRAIVEQNNPAAIIKKVAEDNLTMPELLIDSINERALELLGDMIIEPGNTSGSATIAREHAKIVKKLIKTYEYLSE